MAGAERVRVGVIGLGIGKNHAKRFAENPRAELVALADLNPALLTEWGDTLKVDPARRHASGEELIAAGGLDAVCVATPNKFHAPLTEAALEAGLHVVCEKPMAMTVAEARSMRDAARTAGRNLMINFSFRFSDMSFALKQQVDAGTIGPIYFGRTVWHRRRGIPKFGGWFGNRELSGGGPLIDLGVHRMDLALWLMGHPQPVNVCGATYDVIGRRLASEQDKHFSVEDLACGIIRFANGAALLVEASWAVHNQHPEEMITQLYGERGGLVQRNLEGTYKFEAELYTEEGGNFFTKRLDKALKPAPASMDEFIASILEDRPPLATADDGVRVQQIINALYESAATGREVRIEP